VRMGTTRHERIMEVTARRIGRGVAAGLLRLQVEDERLVGARITLGGRELLDFGSCSYLGLNRDPRLRAAAVDAVERFGVSHSSSTAYTSVPLYGALEERLERILGAPVAIAPTTTLAHLAALPVLIGPEDLALVDAQTHASVHLALSVVRGHGTAVRVVPHNDVAALAAMLDAAENRGRRVWYLADGVYSMFGDLAPVRELVGLLDVHPDLHLYFDDAHGFGWQGPHGRGYVLGEVGWHERMVVAVGFAKSFGTTGAALAAVDESLVRRIVYCGGPFTFSGPLQPAELGASVASADIHLSAEQVARRDRLQAQIDLVGAALAAAALPVVSWAPTPIWFLRIGATERVIALVGRLMEEGLYVNPSSFPAVPVGWAGVRFTHTLHHTDEDLRRLVAALARHVPEFVSEPAVTVDLRRDGEETVVEDPPRE